MSWAKDSFGVAIRHGAWRGARWVQARINRRTVGGVVVNMRLLATLLLAAGLTACSTARVAVDPDFPSATELHDVDNAAFSNEYRFAGYTMRKNALSRGGSSSLRIGPYERSGERRTIEFELAGPGGTWTGSCEAWSKGQSLNDEGHGWRSEVALSQAGGMTCAYAKDGRSWTLELGLAGDRRNRSLQGVARGDGRTLAIASAHDLEGSGFSQTRPAGYFLRDGAAPVGGIEALRPHRVWLPRRDADARDGVAATLAALLAAHTIVNSTIYAD